ncbi:MAG: FAD-dependent oxidoreductase [Candidatus Hydrogenedentota bacterium]
MSHTRRTFLKTAGVGAFAASAAQGEEPSNPGEVVWQRKVPVRYEADVAVLGGGIAGVTAAMAAARDGARVVLVERFAVTGGNATVGGVASFCGETHGQGAVFDAILDALETWNAIVPYKPYPEADNRVFDHAILAVVLQELLLKDGVKLLLHTDLVDVNVSGRGHVSEVIVCGPSGPEALRAKQFIDCTGEAHLASRAGFTTMKGREEDNLQLPMSLMYFVREVDKEHAKPQVPEGWFKALRERGDLPMTSIWPNGPGGKAHKIKIPMFDASDTESITQAEIASRRRMMEVLDYFQRVEEKPWRLDHASPRIGIREGRRILGEYVLNVEELRAACTFDDAIARGVYYLDGHKPDDDKRTYILPKEERKVPPYQIPFRCLRLREAVNVLAAGRLLSADQLAMSSARVMTTCAMMGQAAGYAAAIAVRKSCEARDVDPLDVRKAVEAQGADLAV